MRAMGSKGARRAATMLVAAVAATAAACGGDGGSPGTGPIGGANTVTMPGTSFSPAELRVSPGTTVTFRFPATAHNVLFDGTPAGKPADIPTTTNQDVARTFATAGTFPYHCGLHAGMSARIVVQ